MKILYIAPAFQHPSVRGPTRCYHFIRELSRNHRITLLTLAQEGVSGKAMEDMGRYTEQMLLFQAANAVHGTWSGPLAKVPLIGGWLGNLLHRREALAAMRKTFLDLVRHESFDVVLFHGKSVASVIEGFDELPVVIDFCDATSMRVLSSMRYAGFMRRMWLGLSYVKVRRIERKLLKKGSAVAFVSCRDREVIMGPDGGGEVVSIGVDHQFWKRRTEMGPSKVIVFVGVMDYGPNEDTALYLIDRVLPLVRRSVPDVQVFIVGRGASPALRRRAEQRAGVTVTGFVDDVRPYLERAAVSAVPMRYGSGVQNKVLEAMAMEVPVVTTSLVAAGLRVDGESEVPVYVGDSEIEIADRIVYLLQHKEEGARRGAEGRRYVEAHYDWSHNAAKLERMCVAAAAGHQLHSQSI